MMAENAYTLWMTTDFKLCEIVIPGDDIQRILLTVTALVSENLGEGSPPKTIIDFEQLQVVDYAEFDGLTSSQKKMIGELHSRDPIRIDEIIFLGLKSLLQFVWPEPSSNEDLIYAIGYHSALNGVLFSEARKISEKYLGSGERLPYWGRLAFLRVMSALPSEHVARFGLDKVACVLVKKSKFNATTISMADSALICMNYALEPILKHMNIFLVHFFDTREMAGPMRLARAWTGILPTVLHFWSDVPATRIAEVPTLIFDERMALLAHHMTTGQIDFIVMHELGHVALGHPKRLKAEQSSNSDVTLVRHEFEFAADAFALGLMRSQFVSELCSAIRSCVDVKDSTEASDRVNSRIHDYEGRICAVYLLFTYMDFVQRAGTLLRARLGARIQLSSRMDTHPEPARRLERLELMNLAELLHTSPIQRYGRDFLQSVLDYAADLDVGMLLDSVTAAAGQEDRTG